ncbi:MAG: isoprenylcysteine carboxylmethyltransferase family protein [Planctomycetaceae bacterium]|jgi:methanethiol S-methyltransferase|nr:isoprenylcysteine carboxylmethyltransferase family protein [Planctomycetaceae bacterium]MBT6484589.1 isoprenylcysteine carboxylmethyltransferase family protein [Planctomycetaceae bacterium]MBT6495641.1 isoprenylcysteine carboxylmethyltransferase family protein [Planctomycetaceae bacterium]
MAGRVCVLVYGVVTYALFFVVFLYAIGFVAGDTVQADLIQKLVPKNIDTGEQGELWMAVLINVAILGLFGVQHSIMARPAFKEWWTQFVPKPVERSTFVLATSLILILMFCQWRPIPQEVWRIDSQAGFAALLAVSGIGWLIVLAATFMIDHFDLFGLKPTYLHFAGREAEPLEFKQVMLYRYIRHPIMTGFLIAFWATPVMTAGHLLFAAVVTAYVLVALQLEERDLVTAIGEPYRNYQKDVPMLLPLRFGKQDK